MPVVTTLVHFDWVVDPAPEGLSDLKNRGFQLSHRARVWSLT